MRLIGTLPGEPEAKRLCDYLVTQNVACHIEAGSDAAWQVWIENDDALDRGRAELETFRANPKDPRYNAGADADRLRKEQQKAAVKRQRNYRDVRTTILSGAPRAAPAAVTLIFLTIILSALTGFGEKMNSPVFHALLFNDSPALYQSDDTNTPELYERQAASTPFDDILHGQIWRLVTPIFLHFGILHLVFNMSWTWRFGQDIESVKGSVTFILIVLIVAVISCAAQGAIDAWTQPHGLNIFGGMSGVNAGLFGYAWMCGKFRPYERVGVTQFETGLMLGWLILCSTGYVCPIANAAHWGGLFIGMAIGVAPTIRKRLSI